MYDGNLGEDNLKAELATIVSTLFCCLFFYLFIYSFTFQFHSGVDFVQNFEILVGCRGKKLCWGWWLGAEVVGWGLPKHLTSDQEVAGSNVCCFG